VIGASNLAEEDGVPGSGIRLLIVERIFAPWLSG